MQKYYLVASHYNIRKNKYENEFVVTLPGIDLTSIQAIDSFTASYTLSELLQLIEQETHRQGLNHLAIKYYKNKKMDPKPRRIIENNPDYAKLAKESLRKREYYLLGQKYEFYAVNYENLFFLKNLRKVIEMIANRDSDGFNELYPYEDNFKWLVTRFISSSYDTADSEKEDLLKIKKEFSRYTTFRKFIIAEEKRKEKKNQINTQKSIIPNNDSKKTNNNPKKRSKVNSKSIEEYNKLYEENFQKENAISYQTYQTMQHNLSHLELDKEEFLEEQELDIMYEPLEENNSSKRKR